ncbi:hypothetical protein NQ314_009606 [Rhamnusium bicolor]|uniref:DDE-1 domain-containing protein n=1 Tax=Rhamnusium bicolor TaxID=1586634 RepID=A0AAV8XZM7_9CUCU|nr:hypothetical protein NQ314_009606 [Rhamnusium bicolor]
MKQPQKLFGVSHVSSQNEALNKFVVTSGEEGILVTTGALISASGNTIPHFLIFPWVHFKDHILVEAPLDTLGLAQPIGWMTAFLFVEVMKHFIQHTSSSLDNPSLLIFDNHDSHLSLEVINLAKTYRVEIITLPPHSSNKLQPLDVRVFGPFQTYDRAAHDSWMIRNPGKTFSIYNVAECIEIAHAKAMTGKHSGSF